MKLFHALAIACTLAGAYAQTTQNPAFLFTVQQPSGSTAVTPGTRLNINGSAVGQTTTVTLTATYTGATSATVTEIGVVGGSEITVKAPTLPVDLVPGNSVSFTIDYKPVGSGTATSQLRFVYNEHTVGGGTGPTITSIFPITGVTPDFLIAYIAPTTGNVVAVQPGGTIAFPPTASNAATTLQATIVNRGTAPGVINDISVTGSAFQAVGLPLFPIALDATKELRFGIRYQPSQVQNDTGTLSITLNGTPVTIKLAATATGSQFIYELLEGDLPTQLTPNTSFSLGDVNLGEKKSVSIRVRNAGNADGQITSISILGQGFQLTDLPILPLTLTPGSATIFTLNFTPAQAGKATGRLRIGNDIFDVTANGNGPLLNFSSVNGNLVSTLQPNGTVVFTPAQVGSATGLEFAIQNTGTTSATIASISLTDPRSQFRIDNLPNLPVTIAPNSTLRLPLRFIPNAVGVLTDVLRIDNQTFQLTGTGTRPRALPDYDITGVGGTAEPLQQPAVSLALKETYPLDVNGVMRLSFDSESFSADPSVQFATGGTTVNFTIPAGSRNAIFANNLPSIRLQTGTVAGRITITPTFTTGANIDITPSPAKSVTVAIPALAPKVLSVQLATRTATGFSLTITGYVTSRSLTDMQFTFTPSNNGGSVKNTTVTVPIDGAAGLWFRSSASQGFGGLFGITVPFTLSGPAPATGASAVDVLESAAVTVANEAGRSNSVSVVLR